ncbi:MAG: aminopeptidase P family protein [Acetobacteraceae bacterium]|nr:aminopeptidase P family protein [Acetobacteraceae bacterium]
MPKLGHATRDFRFAQMQALMQSEGLDALAFTTGDNFQFATNFHTDVQVWERPIVMVVPRNGAPFAVMHELSTTHIRFAQEAGAMWVSDIALYAEHPRVTDRLPLLAQWPLLVADTLAAHGLARGRLGVDAGGPLLKAIGLLPHASAELMVEKFRALRWVRCEEELVLMRGLAGLTDWAQARYRENLRPGRLCQELDFSIFAMMAEEAGKRFPGEQFEVRGFSLSGPASAAPHGDGRTAGARFQKGHGIVNVIIATMNGLFIENERTWFCGQPDATQVRAFETARAANEAAVAACITGRPMSGIDAAAQAVIEAAGFAAHILHRTGHGMGTILQRFPEDMAFNHRKLLAGEVYSAEPGIYIWGLGGFRHDDTIVVGDVAECLTRAPKDLKSQTVL